MKEWILTNSPDDAFYYLQLASGKTSWFETNGYHPLWAIITSFLGIFLKDWNLVYATLSLYFILVFIIPFVVWKLFDTKFGFLAWSMPALFTGNLMMEFPLTIILVIIAYKFRDERWSALLFYSRLDTLPLALLLLPVKKWKRFVILISPYFIFNLLIFHTIIPDGANHIGQSMSWANWFGLLVHFNILLIPLALIGIFIRHKLVLLQTIFTILTDSIRSSVFQWHLVTLPVLIILGVKEYTKKYPNDGFARFTVILIFIAGFIFSIYVGAISSSYSWQTEMYNASQIQTEKIRGAYNSGIQGYFSEEKVYNLDGVFSHKIQDVKIVIDFDSYVSSEYKKVEVLQERSDGLGDFGVFEKND